MSRRPQTRAPPPTHQIPAPRAVADDLMITRRLSQHPRSSQNCSRPSPLRRVTRYGCPISLALKRGLPEPAGSCSSSPGLREQEVHRYG